VTGTDTGELAADGRAGQVVGFFGELVPRATADAARAAMTSQVMAARLGGP
jgi:hypothetical protein